MDTHIYDVDKIINDYQHVIKYNFTKDIFVNGKVTGIKLCSDPYYRSFWLRGLNNMCKIKCVTYGDLQHMNIDQDAILFIIGSIASYKNNVLCINVKSITSNINVVHQITNKYLSRDKLVEKLNSENMSYVLDIIKNKNPPQAIRNVGVIYISQNTSTISAYVRETMNSCNVHFDVYISTDITSCINYFSNKSHDALLVIVDDNMSEINLMSVFNKNNVSLMLKAVIDQSLPYTMCWLPPHIIYDKICAKIINKIFYSPTSLIIFISDINASFKSTMMTNINSCNQRLTNTIYKIKTQLCDAKVRVQSLEPYFLPQIHSQKTTSYLKYLIIHHLTKLKLNFSNNLSHHMQEIISDPKYYQLLLRVFEMEKNLQYIQ